MPEQLPLGIDRPPLTARHPAAVLPASPGTRVDGHGEGRPVVSFFVPGVPQPGGSKKGFPIRQKGSDRIRVVIVEDAKKNAPWRAVVALAAQANIARPLQGALRLSLEFRMPRPKKHFRTGRRAAELRADAPDAHTTIPDLTKLIRAVEDAMKGIAWNDDCQVAFQEATKTYSDTPGCLIRVTAI